MKARINFQEAEPRIYQAMAQAEKQLNAFDLDPKLKELIKIRASQINGCGYCLNKHSKDARKLGETEQRLYTIATWWEVPFFTDEERAILKLTEEITHISNGGVSNDVYQHALELLGEQKLAQVVFAIITINSWNRLGITAHKLAESDE